MLHDIANIPPSLQNAVISRIKIISELDIAERRIPQDGRLHLSEHPHLDIRVSTLPTIHGEKIVLRLLNKQSVNLQLSDMDFSINNTKILENMCKHPHGMILATGPTGSGKTTTLHALLTTLNESTRNVVTIEDPVEYRLNGVNQIQVNNKAGLTFAKGLRAILRQDPNIVMVGEIRDTETAEIAVRAALTGHLVLTTLHTNNALGAVPRLLEMGIEDFLVSAAVLAVLAQRLVRRICPHCKTSYTPQPHSIEGMFLNGNALDCKDIILYKGSGCEHCRHTGYKGRMAVQEVLQLTDQLRSAIMQKNQPETWQQLASQQGFVSIREDGIQKALQGHTTIEEVIRIAYSL